MIEVIKVASREEGQTKAHDLLRTLVDGQTLLALSGGTSSDYSKMIVEPDDVLPGSICVIDERYGEPFHKDSNELLMREMGVKDFADKHRIESRKVLSGADFQQTVEDYNLAIEDLFKRFPRRVGIPGVGSNMHTAGIFPNSLATHSPDYVVGETVDNKFPQRITLTLKALGQFTNFVILVFGEGKKEALQEMLDDAENDMQKYPAIFYRKAPIKSYLVTDIDI